MKPKKINKKLEFRKETISNLNSDQLNGVKGGISKGCGTHLCETEEASCVTCGQTVCGTCYTLCNGVGCTQYCSLATCEAQTCFPCGSIVGCDTYTCTCP